jgi:hypothetical protein
MRILQEGDTVTFAPENEIDAYLLGVIVERHKENTAQINIQNGRLVGMIIDTDKLTLILAAAKCYKGTI